MKEKKNLIFDFDGTLVDSFSVVVNQFNFLSYEFKFRYIHQSEINNLRNLTSRELIKYFGISLFALPKVILRVRELMRHEIIFLKPFVGIRECLQTLSSIGLSLGILTSNSRDNVTNWLKHNELYEFFSYIHTEDNFFGKKYILNNIIKKYNMIKSNTFYVGDETRDIAAAKKCGINSVAVIWGFNSKKILKKHNPDFLVAYPALLLDIVK